MLILEHTGPLTNKKLAAKLRNPTSSPAPSNDTHNGSNNEGRRASEAAMDPLSQVCLHEEARICRNETLMEGLRIANTSENEYIAFRAEAAAAGHRAHVRSITDVA